MVGAWKRARLGVGAKIHFVQKHLLNYLDELDEDEGLGVWSETAVESSHGAFRDHMKRYMQMGDKALYYSVLEFNFLKL